MLTKLTLDNFKNFQHAELELGAFTVLIGANATGKSNIREAFRFLHGIGRGYTLPEVIGEKYTAGERVWDGIRGGTSELVYAQQDTLTICSEFNIHTKHLAYTIKSQISPQFPKVIQESLYENHTRLFDDKNKTGKEFFKDIRRAQVGAISCIKVPVDTIHKPLLTQIESVEFSSDLEGIALSKTLPIQNFAALSAMQFITILDKIIQTNFIDVEKFKQDYKLSDIQIDYLRQDIIIRSDLKHNAKKVLGHLQSMRFLDLNPNSMKTPSLPGQTMLGNQGENLSSVLYAICQNEKQKDILLSWIEELIPMDVIDFEFPPDQIGRILVTLVEKNGQRISAYSLSDGTLRFLAILAAFLGPERAKFYFLEELENGIHPTRLHLLTQFIENQVAQGDIQVVATTHSPLLLNYLKPETLEDATILYRLENQPDAHIKRLVDIPDARQLIEKQSVMRLYESGWFEDALFFMDDEEPLDEAEVVA